MRCSSIHPCSQVRTSLFGVFFSLIALSAAGAEPPKLRVLDLSGTPYERGFEHGRLLKEDIHALLDRFEADLERTHSKDIDAYRRRFLEATRFDDTIRRVCPDLLDEVRGMADGSEVPFDRLFAFQLIDEHWSQGRELTQHHCTSLGIRGDSERPTVIGQNLDIPPFFHPFPVLLRITDASRDMQTFVVTLPGLVGANGVNSKGVGVCVNTLLHLEPAADGLPVAFVVRGVLQSTSFEEAEAFLKGIRHASGQNYMIGDGDQLVSLECSNDQYVPFWPHEGAPYTYHTNHPLENEDVRTRFTSEGTAPYEPSVWPCERFQVLTETEGKKVHPTGVEQIRQVLSSREGKRVSIDNGHTFACTIMELSSPPVLHLCVGRPSDGEFQTFRFD